MEDLYYKIKKKRYVAPCYGCKKRSVNCHVDCEDYRTYRRKLLELKIKIDGINMANKYFEKRTKKGEYWNKNVPNTL